MKRSSLFSLSLFLSFFSLSGSFSGLCLPEVFYHHRHLAHGLCWPLPDGLCVYVSIDIVFWRDHKTITPHFFSHRSNDNFFVSNSVYLYVVIAQSLIARCMSMRFFSILFSCLCVVRLSLIFSLSQFRFIYIYIFSQSKSVCVYSFSMAYLLLYSSIFLSLLISFRYLSSLPVLSFGSVVVFCFVFD